MGLKEAYENGVAGKKTANEKVTYLVKAVANGIETASNYSTLKVKQISLSDKTKEKVAKALSEIRGLKLGENETPKDLLKKAKEILKTYDIKGNKATKEFFTAFIAGYELFKKARKALEKEVAASQKSPPKIDNMLPIDQRLHAGAVSAAEHFAAMRDQYNELKNYYAFESSEYRKYHALGQFYDYAEKIVSRELARNKPEELPGAMKRIQGEIDAELKKSYHALSTSDTNPVKVVMKGLVAEAKADQKKEITPVISRTKSLKPDAVVPEPNPLRHEADSPRSQGSESSSTRDPSSTVSSTASTPRSGSIAEPLDDTAEKTATAKPQLQAASSRLFTPQQQPSSQQAPSPDSQYQALPVRQNAKEGEEGVEKTRAYTDRLPPAKPPRPPKANPDGTTNILEGTKPKP